MVIKVVALDIYGTVLSSTDVDNIVPPRKGLEGFFVRCANSGVRVVSASDSDMASHDLREVSENKGMPWLIKGFSDHYLMRENPKEFGVIIDTESVRNYELLVIGDNPDKDFRGAEEINSHRILVPCYDVPWSDKFSFENVVLGELGEEIISKVN